MLKKSLIFTVALLYFSDVAEAGRKKVGGRNRKRDRGGDGGGDGQGDGSRDRDGRTRRSGCGDGQSPSENGYFCGDQYQAMDASDKLDDLWSQCLANKTVGDQPWAAIPNLFSQDMKRSFSFESDELPRDRPKINHAQGVVARVKWEDLGGHSYSGMFKGDNELGLIRMSEGNFLLPDDEIPGLTPSMALKFPRDTMHSANLLANVSFEPTNSFNFFANDFLTNIPMFDDSCNQGTIQRKFLEVTSWIGALGYSDFAKFDVHGNTETNVEFPFDLWFEPNPELRALWPDKRDVPFTEQLQEIKEGQLLFSVMARDVPDNARKFPEGSTVQHIANIWATSDVVTSAFGDERLFFQHEKKNKDFELRPGFKRFIAKLDRDDAFDDTVVPNIWPAGEMEAYSWVRGSVNPSNPADTEFRCPFAWILGETITPKV